MSPPVRRRAPPPLSIAQANALSFALPEGEIPSDMHAISRQGDGSIRSFFGDLVWDWTPYVPSGKSSVLNFQFWPSNQRASTVQQELLREMHWLIYLIAWKKPGTSFGYQTLLHYLKTLRVLARFCENANKSLRELLSNSDTIFDALNGVASVNAKHLSGLLGILAGLGSKVVGYSVVGDPVAKSVRDLARQYTDSLSQFPPLPTRIYSHILRTLTSELSAFEDVESRLMSLARACVENPLLGRAKSQQHKISGHCNYEPQMPAVLKKYRLTDYFESCGLNFSVRGISSALSRIQAVCRLLIHSFSGMREEETGQLFYDCLETSTQAGIVSHIIVGCTTKLNNGKPKLARWVTSREGARAVNCAQRVAKLCWQIASTRPELNTPQLGRVPLFVSIVYIGFAGRIPRGSIGRLLTAKFDFSKQQHLRDALQLEITDSDINELERIDPHRAWRTEDAFQLGKHWTLTSHQLRRSLALYAQRSGLVSLPSLRRQLQHLTEEMARYYARGSQFADNFIGIDSNHFGQEWRDMQPVSSALSYILNVLTTDEVLFGAHGAWVEQRLRGDDGIVLVDREVTIRRFKNGELAYKETILGGCMSTEKCEMQPLRWLNTDCLRRCKNMVGHVSKLDRVIAAQTKLVDKLGAYTSEFRAEKADLILLLETRRGLTNEPDKYS